MTSCTRHRFSANHGPCPYCRMLTMLGPVPVRPPQSVRPLWTYMTFGDAVVIGMLLGVLAVLGYVARYYL